MAPANTKAAPKIVIIENRSSSTQLTFIFVKIPMVIKVIIGFSINIILTLFASRFFKALQDIPIKLVTTSEIRISCLIEAEYKEEAVKAIVKEFEL